VALVGSIVTLTACWIDAGAFLEAGALAQGDRTDISLYEHALSLYEDDLLPEDQYEPWVEPHRDRLRQMHHELTVQLADLLTARGDTRTAMARLRDALKIDPFDETVHERLIRLYASDGDYSRALRQYDQLRDLYRTEFGVAPSSRLDSLAQAIRHERQGAPTPPLPEIRNALTVDGVRIAYWTIGDGPPLVLMPVAPISHSAKEWNISEIRSCYTALARDRTLVRYDARNTGSSDRGVADISLQTWLFDLDAVTKALGIQKSDLFASMTAGPGAIRFAAMHPERVDHLLLWQTFANGAALFNDAQTDIAVKAIERDYPVYCRLVAMAESGWVEHASTTERAMIYLDAATPDDATAALPMFGSIDVSDDLGHIRAPTLVMQRCGATMISPSFAEDLAAAIPRAQLRLLEGTEGAPYFGDVDSVVNEIDAFLSA
jgi:pimeloyl-ACP methyl ester carboxylesterase